jgi:uncharacterized protein (DUF433 family)
MDYSETNPEILLGKPVIKDTRISDEHIISMLAQGISIDEILIEYDGITKEKILACLHFYD